MGQSKVRKLSNLLVCLEFFCLSSCEKVGNNFVIKNPANTVSSAEVRLCNKQLLLTKSEGDFRGVVPITCEGEGDVLIHFSTGHETICKIGYVTPGAQQSFQFIIEGNSCRPDP
jgi:hypothetical protein